MTTFVDTSAIFAYYDTDDEAHDVIAPLWAALLAADAQLVTTNYVLLEAAALLQRRLGMQWVQRLQTEVRRIVQIVWVDDELHDLAVTATLAANRRHLSLVDNLSLEIMRRLGINYALACDEHFTERGYELPPLPPT
ncbi:PIN domain-containing protein [bacterium]|nr:PIN domain-containing protein [bacterium]